MTLSEQLVEQIWAKEGLPIGIREHCKVVLESSMAVAQKLIAKGVQVDFGLVKFGALLHDIGRAKDHSARQGITGYEILQKYHEVPEEVRKIVKYHVGAGLTKEDCLKLKISPAEDLLPVTVEEKIVSYGDNLVGGNKIRTFEETLKDFQKKYGDESAERLRLQHEELENFATRDEMHALEVKAVQKGATIEKLMEKAGKGVAEITTEFYPVIRRKVACFAGPGNNGGDAFVAARYFKNLGAHVLLVSLEKPKTLEGKINLKRAKNAGIDIIEVRKPEDLGGIKGEVAVDGIFGTGIKGEIKEPFLSAIRKINEFEIKIAIDVPSGLGGNESVNADFAVCLGRFKKALVGKLPLGRVRIANIGV
ncbi:TPA: NAD(P)H-hydrate epimerase [archaeon]|nr:NAD(P)H-hydrate epimerase [Candidatus Naiadarchaeales archaeon SRR2090153.bin461]